MTTIDEVMEQEETVLDEIHELESEIHELGGYLNSLKSMVQALYPNHWDGGDRLDVGAIRGELENMEMTVNDFQYDVGQIEMVIDRVAGALDELEGMEIEEEEVEA